MNRQSICFVIALVLCAVCAQRVSAQQIERPVGPRTEMGQEMRGVEEDLLRPKKRSSRKKVVEEAATQLAVPEVERPDVVKEAEPQVGLIQRVEFRGDGEWLEVVRAAPALRAALLGSDMDVARIRSEVAEVQKGLVEQGYYLASLWFQGMDEDTGTAIIHVDAGRVGALRFAFPDREDGRFYSRRQLERNMVRTQTGKVFNYNDFYADVYDLNIHPDLIVDTDFEVESRVEDDILRRDINANFTVTEEIPLHAVVSLNNYGTDATDNWQAGLTLQHLNLTKHDDVLTISIPASLDLSSLRSVAASYSLPYYADQGGRITTYGGYSKLDAQEVVEEIDIRGKGWFAGFQWSHNLISSRNHMLAGSVGVVRRYIEDQLIVADFPTEPRDATVQPYSLALSYTQLNPDALGGRNMATVQALYNKGDFLGSSDDEEIRTLRPAADADYLIARLQLARIQPIFGALDDQGRRESQWILFARAEGQLADGPLIPAEQIGIGGARSVRGYVEREFFGDDGVYGSLELRTPLVLGMFSRALGARIPEGHKYPIDRLQGVLFADGGYTRVQDPLPNEDKDQSISSVGLGFRLALSDFIQMRADWGFPLVETAESSSSGSGYIEIQVQF